MGKITFIEKKDDQHSVDIEAGQNLMEIAMNNGIPGIDADCGGECACGTCHVIVEDKWFNKTGVASAEELQMLDLTPERASSSRLSCQIRLTEDMDGMTVRIPEFQM